MSVMSSSNVLNLWKDIRPKLILLFALVLLLLALVAAGGTGKDAFVSTEVKFTDVSARGLAIVPASCPSSPHYAGECDPPPTCRNGASNYPTCCPSGYTLQGNQCIPTTCQPQNVCDASGTKVVNSCTGAVVYDCALTGDLCVAGQCVTPSIEFESFDATNVAGNTFTATGHLQVAPSLVKKGDTTRVYWKVAHASACTVLGSNGDGALGSGTGIWNMFFSGVTGKTTSAIVAKTTYTLVCQALPGVTPASVQETATVNILPSYQEL